MRSIPSLTELADDLHVLDPVHGSISRKARAAMVDIEAILRKFDAERMKYSCPVCQGSKMVPGMVMLDPANPRMGGAGYGSVPCPDHCDGYISWRRLFAFGAARLSIAFASATMSITPRGRTAR